jgi:hypothetical protein
MRATQVETHLEQRLAAGVFDPGVRIVSAMGIPVFRPPPDFRRHIPIIIRNVRIDMPAMPIIMCRHFPTVFGTTVREVGVPLASRLTPTGIARLWIISLK